MATQRERDQKRAEFLGALYEAVDGDRFRVVNHRQIAGKLGLDDDREASKVAQWLVDEGFADWAALGGEIEITHLGITAYETAKAMEEEDEADDDLDDSSVSEPDDETPLATDDVLGSETATLAVLLTDDEAARVEAVVGEVRRALDSGELPIAGDDARELEIHLDTAALQLRSPRRRKAAVVAALKAAAFVGDSIASGLVGNAAWAGLVSLIGVLGG
jgi:hypothetical protein